MAEENVSHTASVEHPSGAGNSSNFIMPEMTMVILTWTTFFALLFILQKFAWKPILKALDDREKSIKDAIENADKVKAELAQMDQKREQIFAEANAKAKAMLDEARRGAVEAAHVIQEKAKEEAKILLENALRDIKEEKELAQAQLRRDSARIAVALAGKLIQENLDNDKNQRLINQTINEI